MLDQRSRSLILLARLQAALGGLIAMGVFVLYAIAPNALPDSALALSTAILGALAGIYFVTLHQIVKHLRLGLSTLILSVLTGLNLLLIITSTGGLDSPFYAFWILAIVVAGIFGTWEVFAVGLITFAYYGFQMIRLGLDSPYLGDHLIQFGITIAAGGLALWVQRRTRGALTANNRLEKMAGQLTTEQIKAEAIISNIGEGVMVVDGMRKIQVFNKAAAELTGWDESSAQNIDYNLVLQLRTAKDESLTELNDPFIESWNKRSEVVRDNLVATTRSGRKLQISLTISPIFDANNQPSGAIALLRDISKEKEVERQKDEFVSTASHEMRTPVAAIEGYISLAMNPNVATIDDRAKKYLEKSHDTIKHLGDLFRDLLSVTKAEEGELSGRITAVNLGVLMQSAVDDMQFTIQKKNLSLVYQIGGQPGKAIAPLYFVAANPERLREVVMNLIDNAAKYTPEGGIKVTLEGNEKEVKVGISDTGVGISPEDAGHLFQKFYRIDSTATRTIGGTGLGLYLCRKLIEAYNGRIWVTSKLGEGSTFSFSLPRLKEEEITKLLAASPNDDAHPTAGASAAVAAPLPKEEPAAPTTPPAMPQPIPSEIPTIDGIGAPAAVTLAPARALPVNSTGASERIR